MKTGALIVSAGNTPRHSLSPMKKLGSISVAQRLVKVFQLAGISFIVVLVPEEDQEKLEKNVSHMGVIFLRSDDTVEMFENVCVGLNYLSALCDKVLVTPVDVPLFSPGTVRRLVATDALIAVPALDGRRGHPVLLDRQVIPSILSYKGPDGLRGAMRQSGSPIVTVEVEDPGVLVRAGEAEAEAILSKHEISQWRPDVKLQIASESAFFGPGSRQLLYLIENTGSVRLASQQMGMSYSKAWKILNGLDKQLGFPVVDRKKGGKHGGETRLTQQGMELLAKFDAFERECVSAVNEIFHRYFDGK